MDSALKFDEMRSADALDVEVVEPERASALVYQLHAAEVTSITTSRDQLRSSYGNILDQQVNYREAGVTRMCDQYIPIWWKPEGGFYCP